MENTYYLIERMEEIGLEPIIDPIMNIVSFEHDKAQKIVKEMDGKRWNLSRTLNPPGLRFVMMPHTDMNSIDLMVKELEGII